ncbi:translation initiation factor IF-2 subunit gamma [Candidatus Pacearchaeota archaeon CG06_land_8_20_14_3_00_35_12]|nr:MAG: translation initiation factor IF-2 subunit gamma [Candidatus Pacearchaeota archaeon CG06_land_8_20_14_3_00_35_12]
MAITKQPVLNIGLAGHVDHGKTTLLWQLTGKWSDTHSEELKRGITIKLGYADAIIKRCVDCGILTSKDKCKCGGKAEPVKYVSFVDVPGHEMLMATMLSGAAIIDAALLVIAANEGIKPQTKEHLAALDAKGIKEIIIVQNKIDLVSKEQALKNYNDIKNFVKGSVAENSPIIPISAQQGANMEILLEAIDKIPIPKRDVESKPLFFIARSFDTNRPGTSADDIIGGVLGGVLKQGRLKVGDVIEIKPGMVVKKHNITEYVTVKTKIAAMQTGNNKIEEAEPSGSLAIQTELDPGLTKADSLSGCVAALQGTLPEITKNAKLKVSLFKEILGLDKAETVTPIKMNEPLLLSINTAITVGIVTKIKGNEIELGLKIPIIPLKGSKAGIGRNLAGHWRLIGWGEII